MRLQSIFHLGVLLAAAPNLIPIEESIGCLPLEIQERIFDDPSIYVSFIRAYPSYGISRSSELQKLIVNAHKMLSQGKRFSFRDLNLVGSLAVKLVVPRPMLLDHPVLAEVPPSSVIGLLEYLEEIYSFKMKWLGFVLSNFSRLDGFAVWYERWPSEDRLRYIKAVKYSLALVGNIKALHNLFGSTQDDVHKFVYFCCREDNVSRLNSMLSQFQRIDSAITEVKFLQEIMDAHAVNILQHCLLKMDEQPQHYMAFLMSHAGRTCNDDILIFMLKKFFACGAFIFWYPTDYRNILCHSEMRPATCDQVLQLVLENEIPISNFFDESVFGFLVGTITYNHEYFFKALPTLDKNEFERKMVSSDVVGAALFSSNIFFIRYILHKNGAGQYSNPHILPNYANLIRTVMEYRMSAEVFEFLLTRDEFEEYPLLGDEIENFYAKDLLRKKFIECNNVRGVQAALSSKKDGSRRFPMIQLTEDSFYLACRMCPQCILHFPRKFIIEILEHQPEGFVDEFILKYPNALGILFSELNGLSRYPPMDVYLTADFLLQLLTKSDPNTIEKVLGTSEFGVHSMFTLLEFTASLNEYLTNMALEGRNDQLKVLKFFLAIRNDGSPEYPHFYFIKNILFQCPELLLLFTRELLAHDEKGQLQHGLSLVEGGEGENRKHLLCELPTMMKSVGDAVRSASYIIKRDKWGDFFLAEVSEQIIEMAALSSSSTEYSEFLLKKMRPAFIL